MMCHLVGMRDTMTYLSYTINRKVIGYYYGKEGCRDAKGYGSPIVRWTVRDANGNRQGTFDTRDDARNVIDTREGRKVS